MQERRHLDLDTITPVTSVTNAQIKYYYGMDDRKLQIKLTTLL